MPLVCGVKFRGTTKVYHFAPGEVGDLQPNDHVIVETARGKEMARIAVGIHEVPEAEVVGQLKPILARATPAELLDAERYRRQETEAIITCKEQIAKSALPMKAIEAEYSYDGSRLTFYFTSEQRVDFRELVRELAHVFKTRIELRQIGVRDESKIIGGMGKCGRPLCCATWLTEFYPVSIRMAKQQDLPLSPMEISGLCGRLLCCLAYENDYYNEIKAKLPKLGKIIDTPHGAAKVIRVNALAEYCRLLYEDGTIIEVTVEQYANKEFVLPDAKTNALNDAQRQILDNAIGEEEEVAPRAPAAAGALRPLPASPSRDAMPPRNRERAPEERRGVPNGAPARPDARNRGPITGRAPTSNAAERQAPRSAVAGNVSLDGPETEEERRAARRRPPRRPNDGARPAPSPRSPVEGEEGALAESAAGPRRNTRSRRRRRPAGEGRAETPSAPEPSDEG
jgi:cell fate regulator YaaT (PSP1 superfamily)